MDLTQDIQQKIYSQMTPKEKWDEVMRLRQIAWSIKKSFIKQQNFDWSEEQIEAEVKKIFLYAST